MRRSKNEAFAMSEIALHSGGGIGKNLPRLLAFKIFFDIVHGAFFARKISFFVLFLKLGGENCRLCADFVFPSCA